LSTTEMGRRTGNYIGKSGALLARETEEKKDLRPGAGGSPKGENHNGGKYT